jgi:6-hydroxycyclohex-1-ene-1-carbonyl-CoA dehydrogenase
MLPEFINTWQMTEPGKLARTQIPMPALQNGDVVVDIKGCGVCHTDLSYFYMGVPTVQKPPLSLGHEVSGVVIGGDPALLGKEVIVPAVIPCGECDLCRAGRGNRCLAQKMPGNSMGIYGGFSSHIVAPGRFLCVVGDRKGTPLEHLAVVADAVTTPYQAAVRAEVGAGDLVVVVGAAGGVGSFMVQVAKGLGAKVVVGIDINAEKLKMMEGFGADATINPRGMSGKELKEAFKAIAKAAGVSANTGWKIFECTGTKPGQETALSLLSFVGKLVIVGYGTDETSYMLSKLMAFDAEIIGTWGCTPDKYPAVLQMCLDGRIQLGPFVETRPMSQIAEVFDLAHHGKLKRRVILTPDFN